MDKMRPTAAMYVRSAAVPQTATSLRPAERQIRENRARAQQDGVDIPDEHVYIDEGVSGISDDRPDWQRLLRAIDSAGGAITRLYVTDLARLSRSPDPAVVEASLRMLAERGVTVCDGSSTLSLDATEHVLRLVEKVHISAEHRFRSSMVRHGHRSSIRRGSFVGSRAPYGLKRTVVDATTGKWVPDRVNRRDRSTNITLTLAENGSADSVRRIFQSLDNGASPAEVAESLRTEGVPAPRKGGWTSGDVLRIALNPIYMGRLVWGKGEGTELRVENFTPDALVTPEQFQRVQGRLLQTTCVEQEPVGPGTLPPSSA